MLYSFSSVGLAAAGSFHAIAYHGVADSTQPLSSDDITVETLVNHFEWLHANGFTPVSIDQLLEAKKNKRPLPDKAVLLCWDDGYQNFYTHVFPLLKAYNYPGVLALVGGWMTTPEGQLVQYGDQQVAREKFLSWEQIRKLASSDLVEIASHSFDLHKGVLADSAGDMIPATIAHIYDSSTGRYEDDGTMGSRIRYDLKKNSALIREKIGRAPRVMVWPFGRYNQKAVEIAHSLGMEITLTLDPVIASSDQLATVSRVYPTLNPETGTFRYSFMERSRPPLRRGIHIEAKHLIEQSLPKEEKFSSFLERVKTLSPGRVYFEPVVENNGELLALFENSFIPTIQDRLLRLTWHTNRRAGAETHLTLTDELLGHVDPIHYENLFEQLGKSAPCSGLLLSSPRFLSTLLGTLQQRQQGSVIPVWNPNVTRKERQEFLYTGSENFIHQIFKGIEAFQYWQPFLDVGLLVPISVLSETDTNDIKTLFHLFDYILIEMQVDENSEKPIDQLAHLIKHHPPLENSPVLIRQKENSTELIRNLHLLEQAGIVDYSYGYDDFINNEPDIEQITPVISTRSFPFIEQ